MLDTGQKFYAVTYRPMCDLEIKVRDIEKFMLRFLVKVFRGKVQVRQAYVYVLYIISHR